MFASQTMVKEEILHKGKQDLFFNPVALRKAKIAYNFGLSECKRVKELTPLRREAKMKLTEFLPLKVHPFT